MKRVAQIIFVLVVLAFAVVPVLADDGAVAFPTIPKAENGPCVGEPDFMRLNHMSLMQHDRDLRVQEGNSEIEYSLKECVACHVVRDDAGMPVSVESPDHFCSSCHNYTAVQIDCFSCHNSKPEEQEAMSMINPHTKTAFQETPQINWSSIEPKGQADD